jgi:hypothetical protein
MSNEQTAPFGNNQIPACVGVLAGDFVKMEKREKRLQSSIQKPAILADCESGGL